MAIKKLTPKQKVRVRLLLKKFKQSTRQGIRDLNRLLKPPVKRRIKRRRKK